MGIWRLDRLSLRGALIAVFLQGTFAVSHPSSAAGIPAPAVARPVPARAAAYESLLACPTTLDHIGRVVVEVQVNGQGPFRFIVDTGASHSTVSPQLARNLGLPVSKIPLIQLEGITGSAPVPAVRIQTLQAGVVVIRDTWVPVLRTPMMAGADGILGVAGIADTTLLVDFQHNRVRVARDLDGDVRFDYSRLHTRLVSGGLMAVPAYVGHVRALAIIDTGSERSLGNHALSSALHLDDTPGTLDPVTAVYGATPQVEPGRIVTAPMIAIGPLRIAGVDVIYGNFHIFKVWGLEDRPAMILGMDVLGTVEGLGFDFRQHNLFVGRARASDSLFSTVRAFDASGTSGAAAGIH
jgi:Aspartyl protease